MKAKVIATGEIVNLIANDYDPVCNENVFKTLDGNNYYYEHEVDFCFSDDEISPINNIDWEQRRFELVKIVLGGALANSELLKSFKMVMDKDVSVHTPFVNFAFSTADAVIAKLKEGSV